ncbi:hypothetical protein [Cupriavidus sp. SIMBA_020]|uniref:hypothetical protein n=1 Tax=Cupriavidus sp. SIMBA_020 TaxID=3085766 RepID=UPI00397E2945
MDIGFLYGTAAIFIYAALAILVYVAMLTYRLEQKRFRTKTIAGLLLMLLALAPRVVLSVLPVSIEASVSFPSAVRSISLGLAVLAFAYASFYFAKGKGYSGALGIVASLLPFGSITLVFLKDKNRSGPFWDWRRISIVVVAAIVLMPLHTALMYTGLMLFR